MLVFVFDRGLSDEHTAALTLAVGELGGLVFAGPKAKELLWPHVHLQLEDALEALTTGLVKYST